MTLTRFRVLMRRRYRAHLEHRRSGPAPLQPAVDKGQNLAEVGPQPRAGIDNGASERAVPADDEQAKLAKKLIKVNAAGWIRGVEK